MPKTPKNASYFTITPKVFVREQNHIHGYDRLFIPQNMNIISTRAIIDRMSATALRNSKEAFDNLIWGFNLGPRFPSIGLNRTDTFLSLIRVDHENLKLLRTTERQK